MRYLLLNTSEVEGGWKWLTEAIAVVSVELDLIVRSVYLFNCIIDSQVVTITCNKKE